MDTLSILKEKIDMLASSEYFEALNLIVIHISRAEKYFEDGRKSADDQYFNDVIYRSNQAFEGILREAYRILAGKSPDKLRTVDIEAYFAENEVFNERVKNLFTNYRTDWRNASTHNYKLFFTEEEGILAFNSVTSFIYVLLNQITEKIGYLKGKSELLNKEVNSIGVGNSVSLYESIANSLMKFSSLSSIKPEIESIDNFNMIDNEYLILGGLQAYLESMDDNIKIHREYSFKSDNKRYIADMFLENKDEKLFIELKRGNSKRTVEAGSEHLINYLINSSVNNGILYIYGDGEYKKDTISLERNNRRLRITRIFPIKYS